MRRIYDFICKQEMVVAELALALLTVLVLVAAIARALHHPLNWAIDAATFLFAWTVFLGADAAMRLDRLFCITILTAKLPQKAQLWVQVVNYLIIAVFLAGMIGYGVQLSFITKMRTFQGIPGFSYSWVTLSVPFGCALMLVTAILKIRALVRAIAVGAPLEKPAQVPSSEII